MRDILVKSIQMSLRCDFTSGNKFEYIGVFCHFSLIRYFLFFKAFIIDEEFLSQRIM